MKRVLVDTNVLISLVTDRNAAQQARAAALFERAEAGDVTLLMHQIVLSELVDVLTNLYRQEPIAIAQLLDDLLASPNVRAIDEVTWAIVLDLWPTRVRDFADAVLTAVAQQQRCDAIATFDQRFVKQLRRAGHAAWWPDGDTHTAE
ncbi:MAG: PIN domain-containing protein [Acidobacteriota bacterium]